MEGSGKVLGRGGGKSWRVQVQPGLECVIGASKCTKVDSNEEMRLPPPSNEQGARLDLGFDDELGSDDEDEDENGHAEGSNSVRRTAAKQDGWEKVTTIREDARDKPFQKKGTLMSWDGCNDDNIFAYFVQFLPKQEAEA